MKAKKSLGQHFLRCPWVTKEIIKAAAIKPDGIVLEVGPGGGALTRELARAGARVIAVEKDERLAAELAASLRKENISNVEVVPADILQFLRSGFSTSYKLIPNSYTAVGNIPYYLTSRLLRTLLESENRPDRIVFTVQKEVAERIAARRPHMGLLSLSVQVFGRPKIIKTVPAGCFSPAPKVDSAIISVEDISDGFFKKHGILSADFFAFARRAFGTKRKLLTNSLKGVAPREKLLEALKKAGLLEKARPEELSPGQWALLAKHLA